MHTNRARRSASAQPGSAARAFDIHLEEVDATDTLLRGQIVEANRASSFDAGYSRAHVARFPDGRGFDL